ncbi:MAG: 30S ribosomal protein S6 [Patescibacteria group bacterium]|jgi:small subunit ribosomal protein S6
MQYELLYIVPTTFTDEDVGKVESNVKASLEKYGASIIDTKRLGKFRFAYPIEKQRHGHYVLVNMEAEGSSLAKIDEALRISTEVLRHIIVRADEAGGDKFEIVQFMEVNTDMKEDRPRRRTTDKPGEEKVKTTEEIKSGVAAIETKTEEKAPDAPALSEEELDKKLKAALEDDAKEA